MGRRSAEVIRFTAVPFHGSQIKATHCVLHVKESATRLQIPHFQYRLLQALLDSDQLPNEIRWRVIGFPRPGRIEKANINCWNLVIEEIFSRQQVQTYLADSIRMQRTKRLLFGYRNCRRRYDPILRARTCRNHNRRPLLMPYRFKYVQRSHDVRFEGAHRVGPGDRRKALSAQMERSE